MKKILKIEILQDREGTWVWRVLKYLPGTAFSWRMVDSGTGNSYEEASILAKQVYDREVGSNE